MKIKIRIASSFNVPFITLLVFRISSCQIILMYIRNILGHNNKNEFTWLLPTCETMHALLALLRLEHFFGGLSTIIQGSSFFCCSNVSQLCDIHINTKSTFIHFLLRDIPIGMYNNFLILE